MKVIDTNTHLTSKSIGEMKAQGVTGVLRYLGKWGSGKGTDPAEVRLIIGSGLLLAFIYESTKDQMLVGDGIQDAKAALIELTKVGYPTADIILCCDTDVPDSRVSRCMTYLNRAATIIPKERIVVYGGYNVVKVAIDAGFRGWQAYGFSGNSHSVWVHKDPRCVLWQHTEQMPPPTGNAKTKLWGNLGGLDYDPNEVNGDWGAVNMLSTPIETPKEESMANPTVDQFLAKAQADVGIHEHNNDNHTPINTWFAPDGSMDGQPYCAMGVSKWLITAGFKIKKNAGADELAAELHEDYGWADLAPSKAERGDIWTRAGGSHIGTIKHRIDSDHYLTIEANSDDGGVHELTRPISNIGRLIRPPFSKTATTPPPVKPTTPIGEKWAVTSQATQGWNQTLGTKRDMLAKGGKVLILGQQVVSANGNKFVLVSWGGKQAWVRYDHLRYI